MTALLFASLLMAGPSFDLVVKGGRLADGTGNPSYLGDLAIRGGRIVAVQPGIQTVVARVLCVTAGLSAPGVSAGSARKRIRVESEAK